MNRICHALRQLPPQQKEYLAAQVRAAMTDGANAMAGASDPRTIHMRQAEFRAMSDMLAALTADQ